MPSLAKGKHSSQWLEQLSTPRGGRRRRPLPSWLHPGARRWVLVWVSGEM